MLTKTNQSSEVMFVGYLKVARIDAIVPTMSLPCYPGENFDVNGGPGIRIRRPIPLGPLLQSGQFSSRIRRVPVASTPAELFREELLSELTVVSSIPATATPGPSTDVDLLGHFVAGYDPCPQKWRRGICGRCCYEYAE